MDDVWEDRKMVTYTRVGQNTKSHDLNVVTKERTLIVMKRGQMMAEQSSSLPSTGAESWQPQI